MLVLLVPLVPLALLVLVLLFNEGVEKGGGG